MDDIRKIKSLTVDGTEAELKLRMDTVMTAAPIARMVTVGVV